MNPAPELIEDTAGVILAGGRSSRFGANKALACLDGVSLIERIARTLTSVFKERLLVTNSPESYHFLGWPSIGDRYLEAGPLAGIEAALRTIKSPRALIVGCDMPLLSKQVLRFLGQFPSAWDVVLPWRPEGPEPLCAVYHRRAHAAIERALQEGERQISRVLDRLVVRRVPPAELLTVVPDLSSLYNINRPEDLAAILATHRLGQDEAP